MLNTPFHLPRVTSMGAKHGVYFSNSEDAQPQLDAAPDMMIHFFRQEQSSIF